MFKTHLHVKLGCNWVAQLEELGSVARFPDVKVALQDQVTTSFKENSNYCGEVTTVANMDFSGITLPFLSAFFWHKSKEIKCLKNMCWYLKIVVVVGMQDIATWVDTLELCSSGVLLTRISYTCILWNVF